MARKANFRFNNALDSQDIAILEIVQKDNTTPQRQIGERVNLSAAAVQRRLKRMQESGVIEKNVAVVNPTKLGFGITAIVKVQIESERLDLIDSAKTSFLAAPEVQQCYYVTGDTDFVLVVSVETMEKYEQFTRRVLFENFNVKHFTTMVVMDRVKVSLEMTLPEVD